MKKYIIYSLILMLACELVSCNNDKDIDTAHSIFPIDEIDRNSFDKWILNNYVDIYNIELKYRMEDKESDMTHVLIPAEYNKAVVLARIIKHVWLEAYDEITSTPDFLRQYVPKTIHFIGSPAYEDNGTMILGTAEGGMKITLYSVNDLDPGNIDMDILNKYYFETMHHEFAHILHQTKNYDPVFERITESAYLGNDWYLKSDEEVWQKGFVTPYAMSEPREDFVENIAMYVTHTSSYWNNMLEEAGNNGRALINQKFEIVYNYMEQTWGINLDELREIVLRRQNEIIEGKVDLSIIE